MPGAVTPSWDMGQVIGTWRKLDGTLRPGRFKITYPRVTNVTDDVIIPAGVFADGDLNVQPGARSLDLSLPATDDPDNAEDAFTITIAITFTDAAAETYNVAVPVGGIVNLRTIIPAVSSIPVQQPQLKMGVPGGLAILDALGRVLDGDGTPVVGGGAGGPADWGSLTGKPAVIAAGASATEARDAIGAGTSDLALGTTDVTAKAGDYVPAWSEVTGKPATYAPTIGATATTAVAGDDPRLTDARTPVGHTHDDRYFTEAESDGRFVRTVNGTGPDGSGNVTVAGGGGGDTDHGALTGLGDDDHAIYALADGTRGTFAAPLGADDNYVTDAEKASLHAHANKAALDNVSGVNTGDQTLPTWSTIAGKPAVVAAGATQADARTAIGAGTSNLALGTTGTTAMAGNTPLVPPTRTVAGKPLSANVSLSKADVGLENVDNTSDANKPVSTATQTALDAKVPAARTVAGKPLSANVSLSKADVGLGDVDNTSDATKVFAASQITSGTLALAQASPGLTFVVSWNGTDWTYNGSVTAARPTVRTDLTMIAVGGTAAPGFAITGDLWLEALA